MGLTAEHLAHALGELAARDPVVATNVKRYGHPPARVRDRGYATMLRTIIGQQVSYKAADAMWRRYAGLAGDPTDPLRLLALDDAALRSAGLSRQKAAYARGLAEAVRSGAIDFDRLPADDDAAVAALVQLKGIGRWTAEIYLLFSEGRTDMFPAGDLAVQIELGRMLELDGRPSEAAKRERAEAWRPYRGAMAAFLWHRYSTQPI
ncbi:MAG: DNA-3-methyladenine glycosylase 2 family protein [Sphingomonadaceae bacterium]|nr:DNA-3-methyladenine glycosylase 2 family protein [Sphingomonadaceae bacterium]